MVSAALSDHLLQLVAWICIAMLVMMALLLLQITLLRIKLIARTARERRFGEVWRPVLAAAISGESIPLPPLSKGDEILFLKLWNHFQESLRGDAKKRLNTLAERCGMAQHARALLRKKGLRSKLLALTTLAHLEDRTVWDEILRTAQRPDPLLSLAAVRALFQIDADAAMDDLRQELLEREDWPAPQIAILIQKGGTEGAFAALTAAAINLANSTVPSELARLKRLLHLLEVVPHQRAIPAIRGILAETTSDEIVAQCLKFLREPNDLPVALGHLDHPNWIVRLQAARTLGRIGSMHNAPRLAALLSDPVWWVRYRAAQALVSLARGNSQELARLKAHLTDRFALDMLEMVTAEKEAR